jgi:hypothetical protein
VRGIREDFGATTRQSSCKGFLYQFQHHLTGVPAGLNRSVTSEALCPKPVPGSPSWLRYASRQLVQPPEGAKQIPVQVQRILFRPETCLEMGPANALRASFAQAGPQEVLRVSAAHSSGRSCSVDRRLISTWSWVLSEMTLSSSVVITLPGNEPGREHTSSMERRQTSWRLASVLMNRFR